MESQVIAVTKPGCPACEETKPHIARAKKTVKRVRFTDVNVDNEPEIVDALNVQAFPEFVYTNRQGKIHKMPWDGIPTPQAIVSWIDSVRTGSSQSSRTPKSNETGRCTDCAAGGGVDPKQWGPPLWFVIHTTALGYPRNPTRAQKRDMQDFFKGLKDHLPCTYCKKHFAEELSRINSSVFQSRQTLFEWTVRFHNSVRKRTTGEDPQHSVAYWKRYYKRQVYNYLQQYAGR